MKGFSLDQFKSFVKECGPEKVANALSAASKSLQQYAKEKGYKNLEEAGKAYVKEFGETAVGEIVEKKSEKHEKQQEPREPQEPEI